MPSAGATALGYVGYVLAPQKAPKPFADLSVVRCANVLFCASLQVWSTLSDHNGVQGVAGSNPAVPI
jgi:hypothetical protein